MECKMKREWISFVFERKKGRERNRRVAEEKKNNKKKTLPANQNLGVPLNSRTSAHLLIQILEQIFASFARLRGQEN